MMNENRVNNIMKNFEGVGPVREAEYTNQEIVDKLIELQKAMLLALYENKKLNFRQYEAALALLEKKKQNRESFAAQNDAK